MRRLLEEWRHERMEEWARGGLMIEEQFATAIVNARAVAECAAFRSVLDIELTQLEGNPNE